MEFGTQGGIEGYSVREARIVCGPLGPWIAKYKGREERLLIDFLSRLVRWDGCDGRSRRIRLRENFLSARGFEICATAER